MQELVSSGMYTGLEVLEAYLKKKKSQAFSLCILENITLKLITSQMKCQEQWKYHEVGFQLQAWRHDVASFPLHFSCFPIYFPTCPFLYKAFFPYVKF